MLPLFASGLDFEYTLPAGAAAGQTAFTVTDAALYLDPGDPIFLSEPGGDAPDFLGPAAQVNGDSLITALPAPRPKAPGAILWTPALAFLCPVAPEPPIRLPGHTGVETLVTAGGRVTQTRVAAPVLREDITLRGLARSAHDALMQWLDAATEWGLRPFLFVDTQRTVRRARLEGPPVSRSETAPGLFAISLPLLLID